MPSSSTNPLYGPLPDDAPIRAELTVVVPSTPPGAIPAALRALTKAAPSRPLRGRSNPHAVTFHVTFPSLIAAHKAGRALDRLSPPPLWAVTLPDLTP